MFKPFNNRVLVLPDDVQNVTSFGIALSNVKDKPVTGTVVVGLTVPAISEGSKILFSKYGYDEVELEGKVHYVVSYENILGIFE